MKAVRLAALVAVAGIVMTSCPDFPVPLYYGNLMVDIQPIDAVTAGAQWQLDGGAWQNTDTPLSHIAIGSHVVSFKDAYGWTTPADMPVEILRDKTITPKAYYIEKGVQGIVAFLEPAAVPLIGAQWRVDGGVWQESGATLKDLPVGDHVVSFRQVDAATAPPDQHVTVNAYELSAVTGLYDMPGGLVTVTIEPIGAVSNGALWQIDGGPWQMPSTMVDNIAPGNHTVMFASVLGYTSPAAVVVAVEAGQSVRADGVYTVASTGSLMVLITPQAAIDAGAQWQLNGGAFNDSGVTLTGLTAGLYTVSFKPVTGWSKPPDNAAVTITANQATIINGAYISTTSR